MTKLTKQDRTVLAALASCPDGASSTVVAYAARLTTSCPGETAARHLIKLSKLGAVEQTGTRAFPWWRITDLGRALLKEVGDA